MELYCDFNTSVEKALSEIEKSWEDLNGTIVCGTHSPDLEESERIITMLTENRKSGKPTLGICFGYQLMAIEAARNMFGIKDATSEEFGEGTFVVKKRSSLNIGLHGGESWWNWYDVEPDLAKRLATEVMSPKYFGVQWHPEYQSSIDKPHPLLVNFIDTCKSSS